jgi:hypothetical protein
MNYREIKLADGKIVTLEKFEMSFTYDGLLLGSPNKDINDRIISDAIKKYNQNKVLVLLDDAYVLEEILKPITFTAQLTSKPINDVKGIFDGSYLSVIWFGGYFKTISIDKMIGNLKFDYEAEAMNYEF